MIDSKQFIQNNKKILSKSKGKIDNKYVSKHKKEIVKYFNIEKFYDIDDMDKNSRATFKIPKNAQELLAVLFVIYNRSPFNIKGYKLMYDELNNNEIESKISILYEYFQLLDELVNMLPENIMTEVMRSKSYMLNFRFINEMELIIERFSLFIMLSLTEVSDITYFFIEFAENIDRWVIDIFKDINLNESIYETISLEDKLSTIFNDIMRCNNYYNKSNDNFTYFLNRKYEYKNKILNLKNYSKQFSENKCECLDEVRYKEILQSLCTSKKFEFIYNKLSTIAFKVYCQKIL